MKRDSRSDQDLMMIPESTSRLLYAGLVQGSRWRRHLAASPRPSATAAPRRWRSLSR